MGPNTAAFLLAGIGGFVIVLSIAVHGMRDTEANRREPNTRHMEHLRIAAMSLFCAGHLLILVFVIRMLLVTLGVVS